MQRFKKPNRANNSGNIDAIKAHVILLGKMKDIKPLVDPSKLPKKYSGRFLEFVREVSEKVDGAYEYLKKNFPEVAIQADVNVIPKVDQTVPKKKKKNKKKSPVDCVTKHMENMIVQDEQSPLENPFSAQKETEWLLQKIGGLMEILTTENKEDVFERFLFYEVTLPANGIHLTSPEFDKQVYEVFELIFEKAINYDKNDAEAMHTVLAELCKRQVDSEHKLSYDGLTVFQMAVTRRLEHSFTKMHPTIKKLDEKDNERELAIFVLQGRRVSKALRFAGELFNQSVISCKMIEQSLQFIDSERKQLPDPLQVAYIHYMVFLIDRTVRGMVARGSEDWLNKFLLHLIDLLDINDYPSFISDMVMGMRRKYMDICFNWI